MSPIAFRRRLARQACAFPRRRDARSDPRRLARSAFDRHRDGRSSWHKFVIRFWENIPVTSSDGEARPAAEWVPSNGRARMLRDAAVTADQAKVPAVVLVKAAGMKEAWCLATNYAGLGARYIVDLYARRFTIEENFRDTKDIRFGFGLSATHIGRIRCSAEASITMGRFQQCQSTASPRSCRGSATWSRRSSFASRSSAFSESYSAAVQPSPRH